MFRSGTGSHAPGAQDCDLHLETIVAASTTLNAEQRRERARKAHLASAVNAVVKRAPELTPEQFSKLRTVFAAARSI